MNSSPYNLIAKWLADISKPVTNHINKYNSLIHLMLLTQLEISVLMVKKMVLFDVTSLLTNVPLTKTVFFYVNTLKIITLIFASQNIV